MLSNRLAWKLYSFARQQYHFGGTVVLFNLAVPPNGARPVRMRCPHMKSLISSDVQLTADVCFGTRALV